MDLLVVLFMKTIWRVPLGPSWQLVSIMKIHTDSTQCFLETAGVDQMFLLFFLSWQKILLFWENIASALWLLRWWEKLISWWIHLRTGLFFLFPKHKRLFLFVLFCFCSPSSPHWEMPHWVAQCLKEDSRKDFINWKGLGNALHCRYSLLKKACVYLCLCKLHGRTPIGAWMLICNLTSARKKKKTLLV